MHGGQRLVDFMDDARGDLSQRVKPGVLIIERTLLGLLALFALPEHGSRARNHYPHVRNSSGYASRDPEPVRICRGSENKGLSMLREGALPVPESAR